MADLMEYKCPCCGGKIEFQSATQQMQCPFCDTVFELEALQSYDDALKEEQPDDMTWDSTPDSTFQEGETEGMGIYTCQNCGGEIVADSSTAASKCPYCDNPIIMTKQFSGDLKPDFVIPFQLDKKAAKEALQRHLQGKRLLPKIFQDQNHIDEIKGIYVPFWLFDADADANIRYKATKVRTWDDNQYRYTETKYYAVLRSGTIGFEHIPVDGSEKMPDDLMESIEPFSFDQAVPFQTAYLSGYLADRYDVTAEQGIDRANARVKKSTENAFAATVKGYNTVIPEQTSIRLSNGKAQYALYPVWLLHTSWNGENYIFAMNGQTGKFVGDLPIDKGAYWRWFGILTGIIGAVVFLLLLLFWLI